MLVTLHRPSLLFPPSPDGQWACLSVLRWLAHHIKSLPCWLANGFLACASLVGPSSSFPPWLAGQWLLSCASLAGRLRQSLPRRLADDCSPVHYWLAHSDQSHPCQLASGCSACASLAGPSRSVPPSPAGRCGCLPVYHCWPMVTSPTLASWPMVARPMLCWLAHYTESLVPPSPADR